jgi:atypical dual specificity phosphatase
MKSAPSYVILMGLPGSGKSSFVEQLLALNAYLGARIWKSISQDEAGSPEEFSNQLHMHLKDKNMRLIVDRCNVKKSERKKLIDNFLFCKAIKSAKEVHLVFFNVPKEICHQRMISRNNHPSISNAKAKAKGEKIISSFLQQLEEPSRAEGFGAIHVLSTDEDVKALLNQWGCDPNHYTFAEDGLYKFPRTHHLFDAGGSSVSRDDLLIDISDQHEYFGNRARRLIVQEKVDGANLGISINRDHRVILFNAFSLNDKLLTDMFSKPFALCKFRKWLSMDPTSGMDRNTQIRSSSNIRAGKAHSLWGMVVCSTVIQN